MTLQELKAAQEMYGPCNLTGHDDLISRVEEVVKEMREKANNVEPYEGGWDAELHRLADRLEGKE